ncbi:hypothetical protein FS837_011968 [Tulasnella sp. UAMH 9824]|nr:hypothetical protein FS837_011968 [Tulasnella sp. UAMH 9824]
MSHSHRPSGLKQTNKKFKSRHATKGDLKREAKGRVVRISPKAAAKKSLTAAQTRLNRQNHAKQTQANKRHELVASLKLFGGADGAPRIVAVVPLCPDVSASETVKAMVDSYDGDAESAPDVGIWRTRADRFKANLQFVLLPYRQLYETLDACKAADYIVFILSPNTEVDSWGELLLRCLQSQGLPEVVTVMQAKEAPNPKDRHPVLKSLLSFIQFFDPSQNKVHDLSVRSNALNAARALCEGRPNPIRWREGRSYLLAEKVDWEHSESSSDGLKDIGTLRVTGVVRGGPISANRLVHLPNFGDFQLEKVVSAPLPRSSKGSAPDMELESTTLHEPNADDAESLTSRLEPDTMANEQTWPTEEEMRGDDASTSASNLPDAAQGTTPKRVKRVPRGTSAYQATWIVDDDEGDDDDEYSSDEDGEDVSMRDAVDEGEGSQAETMQQESDEEDLVDAPTEDVGVGKKRSKVEFEDLSMDVENEQHAEWKAARAREQEEKEDLEFPDEIDTPMERPARDRFARYRGLRSIRTSPWDPFENLPLDYSRIFQFEDYEKTKRNVKRRAGEDGVQPGKRVTIHIKNVPKTCADSYDPKVPFVLFSLWEYEHKQTVLHFAVQRNTEYDGSVRSKDPLILTVGPRRFKVNPIYSQHLRGGGKGHNNVHKFERYLRHGQTTVATVYGPACFGKVPCMLLRENEEDGQAPYLVGSGTFLSPDTKRIIAKRIVLTGHPFKVHRKVATIRFMFFNPQDVTYFKPVELHTKMGRTGHIQESLGTHGYFKAHFDKPLSQMDTVCMRLYKRVFPKWSEMYVPPGAVQAAKKDGEDEKMG